MKVVFSFEAGRNIDRLAVFLGAQDRTSAIRAVLLIRSGAATLGEFADRGALIGPSGVRRLTIPFGHAAYLLDYRVDLRRQSVIILRIRHSREAR